MASDEYLTPGTTKLGAHYVLETLHWDDIAEHNAFGVGVAVKKTQWTYMNRKEQPCSSKGKNQSSYCKLDHKQGH